MIIKGLQKTTFIDFPGKMATTIFLAGCNLRCHYCHNRNLVLNDKWLNVISEKEVLDFLKKRKKYLDGVCITGGEPLIYKDLPFFLKEIKNLGYAVKLDTNGTFPFLLRRLIDEGLIDYVAMDIKASPEKYSEVCSKKVDVEKVKKSIDIIMKKGIPYEFRSTILPKFHTIAEIGEMAKMINQADKYYLQGFVPRNTLNESFLQAKQFKAEDLKEFQKTASKYVKRCFVRN